MPPLNPEIAISANGRGQGERGVNHTISKERRAMKDMQAHLEMLRTQIAECERLGRVSKRTIKRDIFEKLASHYRVLAVELERAIAASRVKEDDE